MVHKIGSGVSVTREMILETYSVLELEEKKEALKEMLLNPELSPEDKWEINDLLQTINSRIRLISDLLIEL